MKSNLHSFRQFVKLNEGNYGDPDMDTMDWPGKEEELDGDAIETPEERKNRLDSLFAEDEYGSETGY